MYSGTTFGSKSGNLFGVHQRIDRIARRHFSTFLSTDCYFPTATQILHFEGDNGPDGVKRKSPSKDEPWHYIDPDKPDDRSLIKMIEDHIVNLSAALDQDNPERAAFEAAWMAHAVVDGLTPAHHYPLADKIEELFGRPHYERITVKEKNLIRGINRRDTIAKNWQYWGGGGIFSTHVSFELGVGMAMIGEDYTKSTITQSDLEKVRTDGYAAVFEDIFKEVTRMRVYEKYIKTGWTSPLARQVRHRLIPLITKAVCLGWYAASYDSWHQKGQQST